MFLNSKQLFKVGFNVFHRQFKSDQSLLNKFTQGQIYKNERGKSIREYFYFIDHQGQVKISFI